MDQLVDLYFKKHRELHSRFRRDIADTVFGVLRWRSRLDGLLQLAGVKKPTDRDRVKAYLEHGEILPPDVAASAFPGGTAGLHSFPPFLYAHLIRHYGDEEAAEVAEALNRPQSPTLRVNTLRMDRTEALSRLRSEGMQAQATTRSPFGVRLANRMSQRSASLIQQGLGAFQDESSQLAAILSSPREGERVLDACAGAGGKSLALAMLMNNRGSIVAADLDQRKLDILERRARQEGVSIIETRAAGDLDASMYGSFDLVFVDAPCSGTGTLRRSPDLKWRLNEEQIAERVSVQAKLLSRYARFVRPGGRFLYATCSVLACENEDVVRAFLPERPFTPVDAARVFSSQGIERHGIVSDEGYLRTDPRFGDWDGFFAAAMERDGKR